jgi:hypothetical protein
VTEMKVFGRDSSDNVDFIAVDPEIRIFLCSVRPVSHWNGNQDN